MLLLSQTKVCHYLIWLDIRNTLIWSDKVLAIDFDNLDALVGMGRSLYALGKNEHAVTFYDKALATEPSVAFALQIKGLAYQSLRKRSGGYCII